MILPGQQFRIFVEVDPPSVLTPTSCLVLALLTLGVPVPAEPWKWHEETREEIDGKIRRTLSWRFVGGGLCADGLSIQEIEKRWNDPAWLAANPLDPVATVRNTLMNAMQVAQMIRSGSAAVNVIRKGKQISVRIPVNATPEERNDWLAHLVA